MFQNLEFLTIDDAKWLEYEGELNKVAIEKIPRSYEFIIDFYLDKRARELNADVIGIPEYPEFGEKYGFYKTDVCYLLKKFLKEEKIKQKIKK